MHTIIPTTITDSILTSTSVLETRPDTYAAGTTYTIGDYIEYNGLVYESLQGSNLGNTPDSSPSYWDEVGIAAYAEWDSGTTYAEDEYVLVVATHSIYQSLVASNTNNYPPDTSSGTSPSWVFISASEPWKAFDSKIYNAVTSLKNQTLSYEITAGLVSGIAALGIYGDSITIIVTDPTEGEVYNETFSITEQGSNLVLLNVLPYRSATITISIAPLTNSTASIAELVVGKTLLVGDTMPSAGLGIIDYSTKEVDVFGNYRIVERNYSRRADVQAVTLAGQCNAVIEALTSLRATPVIWVITTEEDYLSTSVIYGFYKELSVDVTNHLWAETSLTIEGLT